MVVWADWQEIGMVMMSLVFLIYGIAYMLGMGFQLPKVKSWARNEFYQAVVSAILLGSLVVILAGINGLTNNLVGESGTANCDPFCSGSGVTKTCNCAVKYAVDFMDDRYWSLVGTYVEMAVLNFVTAIPASLRIQAAPHEAGVDFSPTGWMSMINDLLGIVMQFCGMGIGLLWVNKSILQFIGIQLPALFPVGCVLRSFPWTRGAGAAMIALVVGLYVAYPLLVTLSSWMVANDLGDPSFGGGGLGGWMMTIAYNVVVVSIFLPVFMLTLAFAFTKQLGTLLGGDIDVSALAKLL